MMSLQDVKNAVDRLSPEELRELRDYIAKRAEEKSALRTGTMDIDALTAAARAIRDSFTDEEWDEVEKAMNDEYIEPVDDDGFPL